MYRYQGWSRRDVLKAAAMSGIACFVPDVAAQAEHRAVADRITFAATNWSGGDVPGIRVHYLTKGDIASELAFHPSANPSALVINHSRDRLYVTNYIAQSSFLPCGTVETFAVNWQPFRMELLRSTQLTMGAMRPDGLALSPDGSLLAVNCEGCGILNILPVDAHGCAIAPVAAHKYIAQHSGEAVAKKQYVVRFEDAQTLAVYERNGQVRLHTCGESGITAAGSFSPEESSSYPQAHDSDAGKITIAVST